MNKNRARCQKSENCHKFKSSHLFFDTIYAEKLNFIKKS